MAGALTVTRAEVLAGIVDRLNAVLKADPAAMHALVESRVPCRSEVETASPAVPYAQPDGTLLLGLLGVVNAIAGAHGGVVVAHFDDVGRLHRFALLGGPTDG
jgi:hypothetical protein